MDIVPEEYIGWAQVIAGAVIASVLGLLGYLLRNWRMRLKEKAKQYKTVLKKSTDLQPEEVMGEVRGSSKDGFREYCLPRDEIDQIRKRIADGKDVLVIGDPLAGKSRAIYEALKNTDNPCDVTIPRIVDVNPNELNIRQYISGTRKGVLLLDDINKYVSKQHFEILLQQYIDKGYLIVATCRKGPELAKAESALEELFAGKFQNPIELGVVDKSEAEKVALEAGVKLPDDYDGNIGSIFYPLKAMRLRYAKECRDEGWAVLRSIKRLFMAGVYEEGGIFSEAHIKKVCGKTEGLNLEEFKWKPVIDTLADLSFIRPGKEGIAVEETYIERIFTFESTLLDNFRELADLFSDDPDALFKVGNRADDTEFSEELGDDYVKVKRLAVDAFQGALSHWPPKPHQGQHATTQNNLGIAYWRVGEIEDKSDNCRLAIAAYEKALKVYTLDRFPIQSAMTQNNLGTAYWSLSDVEDKAANCRKAIAVYQHALKVYTLDRFPMDYAMIQNNLGIAFSGLGDIEDKPDNCKRAIAAYQEALKVRTLDRFPVAYAMTQNNQGAAYQELGLVEDTAANCQEAIAAYQEALKVRTLDRFPIQYGSTQNNLGNAYGDLGVEVDADVYFPKAIAAYQEALKVRTLDRFPIQYAETQNNLGATNAQLFRVDGKQASRVMAREAFGVALSVYRQQKMPMQVEMVERNIARLDAFEAEK